jgi:hypothetical protein
MWLVGIVFLGLKAFDVIDWPWWVVTMPFWIVFVASMALVMLAGVIVTVTKGLENVINKKEGK